jgi:hypothetical protein
MVKTHFHVSSAATYGHLLILLIAFGFGAANAQVIELSCSGQVSGTNIATEQDEFLITVDLTRGNFWGIKNGSIPGCIELEQTKREFSCSTSNNEFNCSCKNSLGQTFINLSRVTGRLKIDTYWQKERAIWNGIFSCERITSRKF